MDFSIAEDAIGEKIRGLVLKGADMILVNDHDLLEYLNRTEIPLPDVSRPIYLAYVKDFDSIKTLNDADLKELGLARIKDLEGHE